MIKHWASLLRGNPVAARATPFLLFIAFLMAGTSIAGVSGSGNEASSWLIVSRGVVVALVLAWFWPCYSELRSPLPARANHWLAAVVAGLGVFLIWIWLGQTAGEGGHFGGFRPLLADGSIDWPKALLRLAGFSLVVPIMEELFWRSLVLRWIDHHDFLSVHPRKVGTMAFLITTALFALEHDLLFAGAIAGVVYNVLYMWSGNLWVPILAHAVTNGVLGAWILATGNWRFW